MKKLALKLEDLSVDSFETAPERTQRGTVLGNQTTGNQIICECSYGYGTCDDTCPNTCANSCYGGCGSASAVCTDDETCATGRQIICEC